MPRGVAVPRDTLWGPRGSDALPVRFRPRLRVVLLGLLLEGGLAGPGVAGEVTAELPDELPRLGADEPWPHRTRPWLDRSWFDRLPLENARIRHDSRGSWAITGALAGTALAGRLLWEEPDEPRWTGGILFDDDAREWLVADSAAGLDDAELASDVLEASLWTWLVLDTSLTRDREAQAAMWRANIDALVVNLVASHAAKSGFARERPRGTNHRSFYSGHASGAATAAGLLCAHHLRGELYGGGWRDRIACGGAAGLALGVGWMRIRADRHYASDVLVGWAAGFLWGYVLPTQWHYRPRNPRFGSLSFAPLASIRAVGLRGTLRF